MVDGAAKVQAAGAGMRLGLGYEMDWECKPRVKALRIGRDKESMHVLNMGDTGAGKTVNMIASAEEAKRRGETCVILDPHEEFMRRFYDPGRGDMCLNPLDERFPYWDSSSEIDFTEEGRMQAGTRAQSTSLYAGVDTGNNNFFFTQACRTFWCHCQENYERKERGVSKRGATADMFVEAMQHPVPIIEHLVKTGEIQGLMGDDAPAQLKGILGTLTGPLFALKQLPKSRDGRRQWSARDWVTHRKGWLFVTSRAKNRESIAPLQRLWIDSIIEGLLSMSDRGLPRVRMILDEVVTLGYLSSMIKCLSESRKFGIMMVLGMQGRSGMLKVYGPEAEGIFSQPYTTIIGRTRDPEAAEWASKMGGTTELEFLSAHRAPDRKLSWTASKTEKRVFMASQLSGLDPREVYVVHGDRTIKVKVAIPPWQPDVAEGFIPRVGNEPPPAQEWPKLEDLLEAARIAEQQKRKEAAEAKANGQAWSPGNTIAGETRVAEEPVVAEPSRKRGPRT